MGDCEFDPQVETLRHYGSTSDARKRHEEKFSIREDEPVEGLPETTAQYIRRICIELNVANERARVAEAEVARLERLLGRNEVHLGSSGPTEGQGSVLPVSN